MDNRDKSLYPETGLSPYPNNNQTEKIPKRLVFGITFLFIVFLIASIILGILNSKLAWLPFTIFLFLFISVAIVYFAVRIKRSVDIKRQEELFALREIEKEFLVLLTKNIGGIVKRHSEGTDG